MVGYIINMPSEKPRPRPSNEELSELYPTPKTYDELELENNERQKRIASRMPRHIVVSTNLRLYSIYMLAGIVLYAIPDLVVDGSIYGVAMSFVFGMVWLGFTVWVMRYILRDLYASVINTETFFGTYIVCFTLPIGIASLLIHPADTKSILLALLAASIWHFASVLIAIKLITTYTGAKNIG
jgi:hypothetical protein